MKIQTFKENFQESLNIIDVQTSSINEDKNFNIWRNSRIWIRQLLQFICLIQWRKKENERKKEIDEAKIKMNRKKIEDRRIKWFEKKLRKNYLSEIVF